MHNVIIKITFHFKTTKPCYRKLREQQKENGSISNLYFSSTKNTVFVLFFPM